MSKDNNNEASYRRYKNVYPFGMLEDCYDLTHSDVEAAKLFHYYYNKKEERLTRDTLDNMWKAIPIAHQWSNLYITYSIPFKLHSIGIKEIIDKIDDKIETKYECRKLTKEETLILARVEQNRWMVEKLLLGYRALNEKEWKDLNAGNVSKNELKERYIHPDIRPYDDLDEVSLGFNAKMSSCIPEILKHIEQKDIN